MRFQRILVCFICLATAAISWSQTDPGGQSGMPAPGMPSSSVPVGDEPPAVKPPPLSPPASASVTS